MSRIRPLLFVSLAVTLMAGAACGSSSSSGASSAANAGLGVTTTTPPATTASGGGGGDSGFCGSAKSDLKNLQKKETSLFTGGTTADAIKSEFTNLQSIYAKAETQAPDAIKPDLAVVVTFMGKLNHILAADNYNIQMAAPQIETLAKSSQLKQAGAHLKAWAVANCGA